MIRPSISLKIKGKDQIPKITKNDKTSNNYGTKW